MEPHQSPTDIPFVPVVTENEVPSQPYPDEHAPLDPMVLEAIALNMEAALRIYTEHHFFSWTQGLLQNLIRHEVLFCSMRGGEHDLSHVESYSTARAEPESFEQLYRKDAALGDRLVREWEEKIYQPVVFDVDALAAPDSALVRELRRIGATRLIAHGTYDMRGRMSSFFVFACQPDDDNAQRLRLVEMLVPFLHAAWVHTKVSFPGEANKGASAHQASRDLLTQREQEVLQWVYLGKSNIEIGLILGISSLTVKNHVQEILRRLNVQNRAQAVGKAFDLHILSN